MDGPFANFGVVDEVKPDKAIASIGEYFWS